MDVLANLAQITQRYPNVVATLGNFDGIHLGHQALIQRVVGRARELRGTAAVLTFHTHPLKVLDPSRCPPLLNLPAERVELFRQLTQIDLLVLLEFSAEFSHQTPREFAERFLVGSLSVREVFVGWNYRFGRNREGNTQSLRELATEMGFAVHVVEPQTVDSEPVSSTAIRQLVSQGDVSHAARLLGRAYTITGEVVRGEQRGVQLGFPTANLVTPNEVVPGKGVYVAKVRWRDAWHDGVANIGVRPTFGQSRLTVEVHLLDLSQDLYGERLTIAFVGRLRDEKKFASVEALVSQIAQDVADARSLLAEKGQELLLVQPS